MDSELVVTPSNALPNFCFHSPNGQFNVQLLVVYTVTFCTGKTWRKTCCHPLDPVDGLIQCTEHNLLPCLILVLQIRINSCEWIKSNHW